MEDDLKLKHHRITTQIETTVIEAGLEAAAAGQAKLAHDLWIAGFNAEHYWASLDVDPANQTQDELDRFTGLMQELDDLLHKVAGVQGGSYHGGDLPPFHRG